MHNRSTAQAGFSLLEMMFGAVLLGVCTMMGMHGWNNIYRGERANSAQAELDIDVRTAIERIRSETRMSAIEKMVFYPEGPGPYQALSFPISVDRDAETGLVPMSTETNMQWDTTVIYHISRGDPDKLLRSSFYPRNEAATLDERKAQLEEVVLRGFGSGSELTGETATTKVIFANFFAWNIDPTAGSFDAYAPRLARRRVNFGSIPLAPGEHRYTFSTIGKNPASTGHRLGLDAVVFSPTGHGLEAEDQTITEDSPSTVRDYIAAGSWSGRHQLLANPGEGTDNTLTMVIENDRWEETNFEGSSAGTDDHVKVEFDQALRDNLIRLTGTGQVWNASDQTGDLTVNSTPTNITAHAFRLLIRGGDNGVLMHDGRLLAYPTEHPYVPWKTLATPHSFLRFLIPGADSLQECYATIAIAADPDSPKAFRGVVRYLRLYRDQANANSWFGVLKKDTPSNTTDLGPMDIDRTNSYVVTFWVNNYASANSRWVSWENTLAPGVSMSAVATNVSKMSFVNDLRALPSWATMHDAISYLPDVCFLQEVVTARVKSGTFVSPVFDTKLPNPDYLSMDWTADIPAGTQLRLQSRAGSAADLSDASDWSGIATQTRGGGISGVGRYCQFRAILTSDNINGYTPLLKRVVTRWDGELRMVDLGGMVTMGPNYGAFKLTVDGNPLVRGLRFEMTIFKNVSTGSGSRRMNSSMTMEVDPRNSGF